MCDRSNDTPIMSDATGDSTGRTGRGELLGWSGVTVVLVALAVPWFLWRNAVVFAGLPVWIWWHVGWMVLASVVFYVFTQRAWGVGILPREGGDVSADDESGAVGSEEVSQRG